MTPARSRGVLGGDVSVPTIVILVGGGLVALVAGGVDRAHLVPVVAVGGSRNDVGRVGDPCDLDAVAVDDVLGHADVVGGRGPGEGDVAVRLDDADEVLRCARRVGVVAGGGEHRRGRRAVAGRVHRADEVAVGGGAVGVAEGGDADVGGEHRVVFQQLVADLATTVVTGRAVQERSTPALEATAVGLVGGAGGVESWEQNFAKPWT